MQIKKLFERTFNFPIKKVRRCSIGYDIMTMNGYSFTLIVADNGEVIIRFDDNGVVVNADFDDEIAKRELYCLATG